MTAPHLEQLESDAVVVVTACFFPPLPDLALLYFSTARQAISLTLFLGLF